MHQPKFTISSDILKNIGTIEACKEVVNTAPLVPAWEKQFQSDARARAIHFGTHLEGNDLSLTQAKKVIEGKKVTAHDRDVWEVINYRNVLKFIDKLGKRDKDKFLYTQKVLKKIHKITVEKILDEEEAGKFRQSKVVIKDSRNGQVVFTPVPSIEVPFQLDDFFSWLNSNQAHKTHAVLKAGIAHFELARIHPFIDGNGRVARAFATLILFIEDYDIKKFFALEEHFDKDPLAYYQALGSATIHKGDLTVWLEYFTKVVAVELERVKEKVKKLSLDNKLKDKLGRQIALSERQIKLVEYLKVNEQIKMQDAKKVITKVSEDTILRDLKDLIKKGIVKKEGKTKAARYMLVQ
jgi:Fic family protein